MENAFENNLSVSISNKIQCIDRPVRIVFISDLHFDFESGNYALGSAVSREDDFVRFVKNHYADYILCIAGDFYNDYQRSLNFVKRLEREKIIGFFVLGNHDYWSGQKKTISEIIDYFEENTCNHRFFRYLKTGKKYCVGDLVFIGDTGWSSFERKTGLIDFSQISIPEFLLIKDFSFGEVLNLHNEWINYANQELSAEKKVILITHFPMVDFTKEDKDCWWSSCTKLLQSNNCWCIFGHTHQRSQKRNFHISVQRGYGNLEKSKKNQYRESSFGKLMPSEPPTSLPALTNQLLMDFYRPSLGDNLSVREIQQRGYNRCAQNHKVLSAISKDPQGYIEKVKEIFDDIQCTEHIGYCYVTKNFWEHILRQGVQASIEYLENTIGNNDFSDPRAFIIAAIVTGYLYNDATAYLSDIRAIDDYDMVRFCMMLVTVSEGHLDFDRIEHITRHDKDAIFLHNADVYIPCIDGFSLSKEYLEERLKRFHLLPDKDNDTKRLHE